MIDDYVIAGVPMGTQSVACGTLVNQRETQQEQGWQREARRAFEDIVSVCTNGRTLYAISSADLAFLVEILDGKEHNSKCSPEYVESVVSENKLIDLLNQLDQKKSEIMLSWKEFERLQKMREGISSVCP